jgi:tetratricopeptide (TPR) repeat protein
MKHSISLLIITILLSCANSSSDQNDQPSSNVEVDYYSRIQNDLKQYPDSVELNLQLINYLDSIKNYDEAIQQMDALIQKDSLNQGLWYQKAQLTLKTKDTLNAKRYFRIANNIYPDAASMLSLANLLAEQKDKEALIVCTNIQKMFSGNDYKADIYFIKGVYFARTGNNAKAILNLDACINTNYRYTEALMEKGFILYDNHSISAALSIFEAVTQLDPMYADGYFWKAKCLEKNKQFEAAVLQYEKAQTLDPELNEAKEALKRLQLKK